MRVRVHCVTPTKKKEEISAFVAIRELKYYEPRHQSENCNFIKPPSDSVLHRCNGKSCRSNCVEK